MDLPASMQDWWIYLVPGGYLLAQIIFLYDALTHLIDPKTAFHVGRILTLTQSYFRRRIDLLVRPSKFDWILPTNQFR
jgi:hypothetical protein